MCSSFNYTSTKPTTSYIFCSDHAVPFRPDGLEPETYFEGQFAGQSANASSGFMAQGLSNQGIIKAGYSHRIGPRGNLWTCLNGICAR